MTSVILKRKQILVLTLLLIFSMNSYSQIAFESGYFITQDNQKTNCLIENLDWQNTPTSFRYQLPENQNIVTMDLKTVKEFAITGQSKYIKAVVKIDRSSKRIENMSTEENPVFKEETLFLKVLIEGKASLYSYIDGHLTRFFYKTDHSEIKQLVYKNYLIDGNSSIAENNSFRRQLFVDLKCETLLQREYEHLSYNNKALMKFFIKYNTCSDTNFTQFVTKEKRDLFNLTVRPRLNMTSLSTSNSQTNDFSFKFGNQTNFSAGLEAEFILPFNKNKWAIIVEPTYQYYKGKATRETSNLVGGEIKATIDYKSIELPIGVRHYFFLKNDAKIFVNASFLIDFNLDSKMKLARKDDVPFTTLDVSSLGSAAFGIGGKLHDKYSIEIRYITPRTILKEYLAWDSSFATTSLIFGYSFF